MDKKYSSLELGRTRPVASSLSLPVAAPTEVLAAAPPAAAA